MTRRGTTIFHVQKIPPCCIPAHFQVDVKKQLQSMLDAGIIEESFSPGMVPAVLVQKKLREIGFCLDYREPNKKTVKDAYPHPQPD